MKSNQKAKGELARDERAVITIVGLLSLFLVIVLYGALEPEILSTLNNSTLAAGPARTVLQLIPLVIVIAIVASIAVTAGGRGGGDGFQ